MIGRTKRTTEKDNKHNIFMYSPAIYRVSTFEWTFLKPNLFGRNAFSVVANVDLNI